MFSFNPFADHPQSVRERRRPAVTHKYYDVLEVKRDTSAVDIKKQYRKLAFQNHPDKGGDEEKFKQLQQAYGVLKDPVTRRAYDLHGDEGVAEAIDRQARTQQTTPDVSVDLEVSLREVFKGATKKITHDRTVVCLDCAGKGSQTVNMCKICDGRGLTEMLVRVGPMVLKNLERCGACQGTGETFRPENSCGSCRGNRVVHTTKTYNVAVPRGAPEGFRITIAGGANEAPGLETGDLVVQLRQKDDSIFRRVGDDLVLEKEIGLAAALCGSPCVLQFLDGKQIHLSPPDNHVVSPGDVGLVRGKGMYKHSAESQNRTGALSARGDLWVEFYVKFPSALTPRCKQLVGVLFPEDHVAQPSSGGGSVPVAAWGWVSASNQDLADRADREDVFAADSERRQHPSVFMHGEGDGFAGHDCRQQ